MLFYSRVGVWIFHGTLNYRVHKMIGPRICIPLLVFVQYTKRALILGVSACHALMKNRQRASYDTLFNCLETALVNKFGSIGIVHTMIMDFETASRAAATAAFKGTGN